MPLPCLQYGEGMDAGQGARSILGMRVFGVGERAQVAVVVSRAGVGVGSGELAVLCDDVGTATEELEDARDDLDALLCGAVIRGKGGG